MKTFNMATHPKTSLTGVPSAAEVHETKYKQLESSSQNTHLIKTKKSTCQDKIDTIELLGMVIKSRLLANIFSFVIQNLTEYIHWQS
jgi:hypothetical protein